MIKYKGITTLEVLEEAKNYNKWIASEIIPHLKHPVLEVGSGTGNLSQFFISNKIISLSDNDKGLVNHLKKKYLKNRNVTVVELDITKNIKRNKKYLSIFAVNVLEHIKDDKSALKNLNKLLSTNGRLILLVPAKQFAFTKLDTALGHHRRYEKSELEKKVLNAGFTIEKVYYFNFVGLLSWKLRALIEKDNQSLKSYQVKIFDKVVPLLKFIERKLRPPVGISLILVAKKNEE